MNLSQLHGARRLGRKPKGMAALLLPFEADGSIAIEAYQNCLRETIAAGLTPAVNMDTGYANLLSNEEKRRMLRTAEEAAEGFPFVAGAFVEGQEGDLVALYRRQMEEIAVHGGIPILFQTTRTRGWSAADKVKLYAEIVRDFETVYAFELGQMFAPFGEIWDLETYRGILDIPQIKGAKHSSLDRVQELERIRLRDEIRPDFSVLTGNDLGIDMIEFGSDYLLGLATFSPASFAERDRLWASGEVGYLQMADALQHLGNLAFRPPVPAYKHSCAIFLHLLGKIPTSRTHPAAPERPPYEVEILRGAAERLGLLD